MRVANPYTDLTEGRDCFGTASCDIRPKRAIPCLVDNQDKGEIMPSTYKAVEVTSPGKFNLVE